MNSLKHGLIITSFALAPLAVASANENDSSMVKTDAQRQAVEALKDTIPGAQDITVENILTTSDGLTCITYSHAASPTTPEHAVVKNGEVDRATLGNQEFEEAWNEKCVPASKRRSN